MASPSGVGGEGRVVVGIFTPAFTYPASLSYASTCKAALKDLGLQEDECDFLKQDNDKVACWIKNNKFTLQYVEETYAHNKALLEQLQRAAEALVAFKTKLEEDATLICELKQQIHNDNSAWELKYEEEHNSRMILQGKLEKLKFVVNSEETETNRPKIPKLQLQLTSNGMHSESVRQSLEKLPNGITTSPRNPTPSPREHLTHTISQSSQTHPMNMNGKRSISSSNILQTAESLSPHGNGRHARERKREEDGGTSNEASPRSFSASPRAASATTSPRASPRGALSPSPRSLTSSGSSGSSGGSSLHLGVQHTTQQQQQQHAAAAHAHAHTHASAPPGGVQHIREHVREHARRHSTNFGGEEVTRRHSNAEGQVGKGSSPRSKSSSEIPPHYFDLTQPFPDVHSMMPVVHSYTYSDSYASKRRSVVSPSPIFNSKSRSEAQLDFPVDTLSQKKQIFENRNRKLERASSFQVRMPPRARTPVTPEPLASSSSSYNGAPCRLCCCEKFRGNNKAEWMCTCGHANIKHAVFLKASPAPSPTVSPRKHVG